MSCRCPSGRSPPAGSSSPEAPDAGDPRDPDGGTLVDGAPGGDADSPDGGGGLPDGGGTPDAPIGTIGACGELAYADAFTVAPHNAVTDHYLRCASAGAEAGGQLALAPSGARLAIVTTTGTVRLFATDPWREVAHVAVPIGVVAAAAFSPDGATLATLDVAQSRIDLWSAADGAHQRTLPGGRTVNVDDLRSVLAFSADGGTLASSLGAVVDLDTGAAVATFAGRATHAMTFAPGGSGRLYLDQEYRVGNSPVSRRLVVLTPATGAEVVLFDMYDRALTGVAVSRDGGLVALTKTEEVDVSGNTPGLSIHSTTTGATLAGDPTFTGAVLAFSPDGTRLYTVLDDTVTIHATADLAVLGQFAWPTEARLVGVAPGGELVTAVGAATSWRDPETGVIRQMVHALLTQIAWTADGGYGAGVGTPDRMFTFWREAGAVDVCAAAGVSEETPILSSLGTATGDDGHADSADGSTLLRNDFDRHTAATDWYILRVRATATDTILRAFGSIPGRRAAAVTSDGTKVFTVQGSAVATWCR